jgi:hypothetical protein
MSEFAQQLLTSHPNEASQAFGPLVALLVGLLDDAEQAGAIRAGVEHTRLAGIILQAIMFNAFATTISGENARKSGADGSDELWNLIFRGISTDTA